MTMMRDLLTTAALICGTLCAGAAGEWSLDSCITYAVEHNLSVRSKTVECESAKYDVTEAKDKLLPSVSGYGAQSFSFGRGLTAENTYANRNTSNFNVGANLQLPLFQGLAGVRRIDYAKANLRMILEQLEAEKENVELNVITLYLQALYTAEVAQVGREQARMSAVELQRRRDLVDAGKLPELDLYEAQSQLAQDELSVVTADNDHRLALLDLAQMLELDNAGDFAIAPLACAHGEIPDVYDSAENVFVAALSHNHSLRASQLGIAAADRQLALARTGWIPTLSFNAGLGTNYYRLSRTDNPSFGSQMRQNFQQSVGFTLSVPIFDAFATRNSVRKARLRRFSAEIELDNTRNKLFKAIEQAHTQATAAQKRLEASLVAEDAAAKAFEGMQTKYNYGKATSTEFEQAKAALIRSRLVAVQAHYEMLLRNRILRFYAGEV